MFALSSITLLTSIVALRGVVAQTSVEPLTDRRYTYPDVPYKVDTNPTGRGPQFGYTLCNSTTEGPNSDCQLAMINHINDFCLWGPPIANSTIADTEAETVAFCTNGDHGTRVMPEGTLTGVQFLKAPSYILVAGTINQQNINIQANDEGGELDPHGADERGNPLGSLVYSNAFPSNNGNNNSFQQVIEWHNFMGSDVFCFKICDPSIANSKVYCNNIYDETGCNFVAPAAYQEGVFEVCDSDNMDPVGVYTSNGVVETYTQPAVVTSLPSIRTPSSSNCVTYSSADLFANAPTVTGVTTTSAASSAATSKATSSGSAASSETTKPTTSSNPSSGSASKATTSSTSTSSSGAAPARVAGGIGAVGVLALGVSLLMGGVGILAVL